MVRQRKGIIPQSLADFQFFVKKFLKYQARVSVRKRTTPLRTALFRFSARVVFDPAIL
jgi:hypothetical protein